MNRQAAKRAVGKKHRESRCQCGQLVAKLHAEGVEVKCKRCKRIVLVPYEDRKSPMTKITH